MIDNVDISDNKTLTISAEDDIYTTIEVSNSISGEDKNISITLNSQNDSVDYTHDTISILNGLSSSSTSGGCSSNCIDLIDELKDDISETLDNYLLKELFYEYSSNFSDAIKYISYLENNDLLYASKTLVSQKSFVMFYDDSQYDGDSEDGDSSSGGTYFHDQLQNLDVANQHPITAITGLSTALSLKLNSSSISDWAKASTKPSYSYTEITGLSAALDLKLTASSYTASDVLSKIKTVDGSGSGLDADLLGGYSSSDYYRIGNANLSTIDWACKNLTAAGYLASSGGAEIGMTSNAMNGTQLASEGNLHLVSGSKRYIIGNGSSSTTGAFMTQMLLVGDTKKATFSFGVTNSNVLEGRLLKYNDDGTYTLNYIFHSGNSNRSTIDWACKDLTASGDIQAGGTVVMYSTT